MWDGGGVPCGAPPIPQPTDEVCMIFEMLGLSETDAMFVELALVALVIGLVGLCLINRK